MENLKVTPDFLRQLAQKQTNAADTISTATAQTEGLANKVVSTHGVVCWGSHTPIKTAEAQRQRAITELATVSQQTAERLLEGLDDYKKADDESKNVMDKQVRP
jgi:hypothetical protein